MKAIKATLSGLLLLLPTAQSEKIIIHEIQEQQQIRHQNEEASPFLSATLKTEISPVYSNSINSDQLDLLSKALVDFLEHIFEDQQVYDVEVVGVAIFEEELVRLNEGKRRRLGEGRYEGRKLMLNGLQAGQFYREDDEYDDDDEYEELLWDDDETDDDMNSEERYTLTFATVVSAEHKEQQSLSHSVFQTMLIHICHKFATHLVEFVKGIDDEYFENVESVIVSGYEMTEQAQQQSGGFTQKGALSTANESEEGMSDSKNLSIFSIIAIAVGTLAFVVMAITAVKFRR